MRKVDVVVVGSYNRDLSLAVARLPAPGETVLSLGRLESPGGKGSNQAIQAARCGAATAMIAAIGIDAAGDEALSLWAAEGIASHRVMRLAQLGTGTAAIVVEASGENIIVVDVAANAALSPAHVEAGAAEIGAAKVVLAQLETPWVASARAFEIARETGATTVLNAAPASAALDPRLLALTDVLVVNEGEAQSLAGAADLGAAAEALLRKVGHAVVITMGADGARLLAHERVSISVGSPMVDVVDTTGAGDAFCGAFAARLAAHGDLAAALAWGVTAGALACTAKGAAASCADRRRIEALVEAAGGGG